MRFSVGQAWAAAEAQTSEAADGGLTPEAWPFLCISLPDPFHPNFLFVTACETWCVQSWVLEDRFKIEVVIRCDAACICLKIAIERTRISDRQSKDQRDDQGAHDAIVPKCSWCVRHRNRCATESDYPRPGGSAGAK